VTLFKQRKNKQFNYKPRFLKEERDDLERNLESQWKVVKTSSKRKRNIFTTMPFLVLFLIAVLVLFYLLNQYETT
jgi:type VI protein secretion system component VasF